MVNLLQGRKPSLKSENIINEVRQPPEDIG